MGKQSRQARAARSRAKAILPVAELASTLERATTAHIAGHLDLAERLFGEALRLQPSSAEALHSLGVIAMQRGRPDTAAELIARALALRPAFARAHANLGTALAALGRMEEALTHYDRALELDSAFTGVLNNRGGILQRLGRYTEAAEAFARLVRRVPDAEYALGNLAHSKRHDCDWRGMEELQRKIIDGVGAGKRVDRPFSFLSVSASARHQLECSRLHARDLAALAAAPLWRGGRYTHDRIRIAYVSADFRDHIVSYFMASVLERHDQRSFHPIAMSLGPEDGSAIARRLRAAFESWHDVHGRSDAEAARLLREMEVDIAVDLTGHTDGARPGILARRPAPVQVSYLGFPATTGAPYIDYILADDFVVPPEYSACYSECIVRLPDTFQANDERRSEQLSSHLLTRTAAGLPEGATVFCCFNNSYKLSPAFFDVWMRLLRSVPECVLWLLSDRPAVERNLRGAAAERGVAPERLVFARRVPYGEHLARLTLADLFLDTLPFNGGATVSDALWAGLPVLTCTGEAFAARMAGSLLSAVGLPQLITRSIDEYECAALDLARNPGIIVQAKATLARARTTAALYDSGRFCRHLEEAYRTMADRVRRGEPPASFSVARLAANS